ncbi:hypothetical protein BDV3_006340 [Batrachochytrium dendrobatidis]|uniref:Phosphatidylinositol 4-kinase n=1 Tax=Batrachochytrium dendrobatidis (strain JEL423) TaxID=403673 RepID=A0A177WQD1_BATDL|nr:hypothetical protein BDEG_25391 [Batrachochytrium dendrobatidis JEL423]
MSTLWPNNPAGHNSDTSVHANIQVTNSYNADDDADEYSDQRPLLPSYPEPASNYNHLSTHRRDCPLYQQGHRYLRSASSRSLPLLLSDSERIAASRATCETMSINVTTDSHAGMSARSYTNSECICHSTPSHTLHDGDIGRSGQATSSSFSMGSTARRILPLSFRTTRLASLAPSLAALDPFLLDKPLPNNLPPPVPRDSLIPARPAQLQNLVTPVTPVSTAEFVDILCDVQLAIHQGIYPTRISQGSSGSYFCRSSQGQIVGVFKPKNEEPYGNMNPKWTKWLHRNLFPCCFGRTCIVPNQGYVSEAAASYLDRRLGLNLVPRTEIVCLASPTFHYSFRDRWAYRIWGKPLPTKTGSFQLFLTGYKDATTFFRQGYECMRAISASMPPTPAHTTTATDLGVELSQPNGESTESLHEMNESRSSDNLGPTLPPHPLGWTPKQQLQFQLSFERLVILDYLIRNTDRSSDNWMVKWPQKQIPQPQQSYLWPSTAATTSPPPLEPSNLQLDTSATCTTTAHDTQSGLNVEAKPNQNQSAPSSVNANLLDSQPSGLIEHVIEINSTIHKNIFEAPVYSHLQSEHDEHPNNQPSIPDTKQQSNTDSFTVRIAAIDNGLAFPTHHPDRMRSYPYSWAFLPIAHKPFSPDTAHLVLPLITSSQWWETTFHGLETLFRLDRGFQTKLWRKQRSVIRGQGYNLTGVLGKVSVDKSQSDMTAQAQMSVDDVDPSSNLPASPYHLVRLPAVLVHEEVVEEEMDSDTDDSLDSDEEQGVEHAEGMYRHQSASRSADHIVGSDGLAFGESGDERHYLREGNHGHATIGMGSAHVIGRRHNSRGRAPSFIQRQKKKLRRVQRRLETLTLRQPCCTHW